MNPSHESRTRRILPVLSLIAALVLVVWAGCSSDDNPTKPLGNVTPTTTSMSGEFLSGTTIGSLSLTINSATLAPRLRARSISGTIVTASGTFKPSGGASVGLIGTYDTEADTLNLSGSGYTLRGQADTTGSNQAMYGRWEGTGGPGTFGCAEGATSDPVSTYCGDYESVGGFFSSGKWSLLIMGSEFGGMAYPPGGSAPIGFEGVVTGTGSSRDLSGVGNEGDYQLTLTGTLNTTPHLAAGEWQVRSLTATDADGNPIIVDTGTWSAGACP